MRDRGCCEPGGELERLLELVAVEYGRDLGADCLWVSMDDTLAGLNAAMAPNKECHAAALVSEYEA